VGEVWLGEDHGGWHGMSIGRFAQCLMLKA
jgi:hypothetical protein